MMKERNEEIINDWNMKTIKIQTSDKIILKLKYHGKESL